MFQTNIRSPLILSVTAIAFLGPPIPLARAQAVNGFPLQASNFSETTSHGFGDRNNSWAQSMIWWNGNLYVGTSRDSDCVSLFSVYEFGVSVLGATLANEFLPYPPQDPTLPCYGPPPPATNPEIAAASLPLAAQIWRWSPATDAWTQVYESPTTLPNPGPGPPLPPLTGYFLPYEVAFRGFAAYTETDGTQALYAFGVNSTAAWDRNELPPPRILRTTDGINWTPLPQDPGTFLGTLSQVNNGDHSTYRSPVTYNGMLFTLCGPINGQGNLIASANPSQGDNAWFLAEPSNLFFYELAVFNGWLYIGGYNPQMGYSVYKTQAQGSPFYQLKQIVPPGAGLSSMPSASVVSMSVHDNRLYVGTATFAELIRINADDTWDLVMGTPRVDPATNQWKYPTSNLGPGFGLTLNDHVWYQDDAYNYLYAGTYNASTGDRYSPGEAGVIAAGDLGAQLYVTPDDYYWSPVTTNGFSSPADPQGGIFDYGFRTMASTPYGMFLGTANDSYGLMVFRGTKGTSPPVQQPGRLDVEPDKNGGAFLSWLPALNAKSYQIWRAPLLPIQIRQNLSFENWGGSIFGAYITDIYPGTYILVGTSSNLFFHDTTTQAGAQYMYYVIGASSQGAVSPRSNLVTFPLLLPSITFAQLLTEVSTLANRNRFTATDPQGSKTLQVIQTAQTYAVNCQISTAINSLTPQTNSRALLAPDLVDYQVLVAKLIRRLQLYNQYPGQLVTTELCTGP